MSKLYNIGAYGIPESVDREIYSWKLALRWTRHAKEAAINDKYGVLPEGMYPSRFHGNEFWEIVEVEETPAGYPVKVVVRRKVDENRSLVLVILKDRMDWECATVKTCWVNLNSDNHRTLDKSKFSKP